MSDKKQSSVKLYTEEEIRKFFNSPIEEELTVDELISKLTPIAMHKEEVKMIIEHYHNNMFYLKLTEKELKNITEIIYDKIFGG